MPSRDLPDEPDQSKRYPRMTHLSRNWGGLGFRAKPASTYKRKEAGQADLPLISGPCKDQGPEARGIRPEEGDKEWSVRLGWRSRRRWKRCVSLSIWRWWYTICRWAL